MKRNKLFIAGLVTVFVALCSLTLVSSTWAKYTSSASGSDSARVAYWGFDNPASLTIDDLFVDSYNNVKGEDEADVIAPGCTKTVTVEFKHNESHAPEVGYTVAYQLAASGELLADLDANANFKWLLNGTEYNTSTELAAAVAKLTTQHKANEVYDETFTIGWAWYYSTSTAGDTADTLLGNAALNAGETVTITLTATATQVD